MILCVRRSIVINKKMGNKKMKAHSINFNNNIMLQSNDLIIYSGPVGNKLYCAAAYFKSRSKSQFYVSFKNEEERKKYCDDWIEKTQKNIDECNKIKKERREADKIFNPKDYLNKFFHHQWGYEQTNNDYLELIEVISKSKGIARVASKRQITSDSKYSSMSCDVLPISKNDGETYSVTIKKDRIILSNSEKNYLNATYFLHDGKPDYESWYA